MVGIIKKLKQQAAAGQSPSTTMGVQTPPTTGTVQTQAVSNLELQVRNRYLPNITSKQNEIATLRTQANALQQAINTKTAEIAHKQAEANQFHEQARRDWDKHSGCRTSCKRHKDNAKDNEANRDNRLQQKAALENQRNDIQTQLNNINNKIKSAEQELAKLNADYQTDLEKTRIENSKAAMEAANAAVSSDPKYLQQKAAQELAAQKQKDATEIEKAKVAAAAKQKQMLTVGGIIVAVVVVGIVVYKVILRR